MFGENWTRGSPDRRQPWPARPRPLRRLVNRNRVYPRGYRKPENAPRGRMSAYAFFIQTCREEHKLKHPDQNIIFREFSRKCADRWKTLSDEEKQHFSDMAAQDRARYAKELESYSGPRIRNRRRKTRKDPRAPKRALSAFFWFCSDERPKLRAINPNASVGKVAKELGLMWANADQDVKDKYNDLALKDKERYEIQMEAYKKGNFIRHVDRMDDLPPLDPANNGKIPNTKKYNYYVPPSFGEYIGHTVGISDPSEGDGHSAPPAASTSQSVNSEEEEENGFDAEEDEMVSDEEMEDDGSVIEDALPEGGLAEDLQERSVY